MSERFAHKFLNWHTPMTSHQISLLISQFTKGVAHVFSSPGHTGMTRYLAQTHLVKTWNYPCVYPKPCTVGSFRTRCTDVSSPMTLVASWCTYFIGTKSFRCHNRSLRDDFWNYRVHWSIVSRVFTGYSQPSNKRIIGPFAPPCSQCGQVAICAKRLLMSATHLHLTD